MKKNKQTAKLWFLAVLFIFLMPRVINAGTLSCAITTAAACTGTVIYRMSGSTNAHAELSSQSTAAYADNVVCCSGVADLSTACVSPQATALNLTAATNSHASQTATEPYTTPACISVPEDGSVSTGYQETNCDGYDTTLGSMSGAANAHVGNGTAYTTKICATALGIPFITLSASANNIAFGDLSSTAARFANTSTGSGTEVEAHTLSVSTNAASGYTLAVKGATLTSGGSTITAIGDTNTASSPGSKQFGLRMTASGGSGTVSDPYAAEGFAYAATASVSSQVASASVGDGVTTVYSVRYIANITSNTKPGAYTATLTYTETGNF